MPGSATHTRAFLWALALAIVAGIVYLMATADAGPADPIADGATMSRASVVANSAIIVFREGLEAVLIFAAVTASFLGANRARRRPVVWGAAVAFGAAVATWFAAQALLDVASPLGPRLEAITGFLAIVVLMIVLNWFVHRVYWSEWIGRHHRRRRQLLGRAGVGATVGLVALGFTSVYREGFETVLFLQNLELQNGTGTVLEGVAIGLAGTAAVGLAVFWLHHSCPTGGCWSPPGVLVGLVLVVMIGGTALTFQDLGWLPRHETPFEVPGWMGAWFEMYSDWETLGAQVVAGVFVIGSYAAAKHVNVTRRVRRGEVPAQRAVAAPAEATRDAVLA